MNLINVNPRLKTKQINAETKKPSHANGSLIGNHLKITAKIENVTIAEMNKRIIRSQNRIFFINRSEIITIENIAKINEKPAT